MNNKLLTMLGFAAKSGNLSYGMDMAESAVKRKKAKLVIISCSISEKSRKEVRFFTDKNNVRVLELDDCDTATISDAVGRNCGILSVNDSSFATAVLNASGIKGGNANDEQV